MSKNKHKLLLAFYGDDFTGSTDALEFLSRAGAKTILFTEPPTAEQLNRYEGLDALGVAGMTRSMMPADMEKVLRPALKVLKSLHPAHVHYKVCSTFDSSPTIGSIGKAAEIGSAVFQSPFIPALVAAPALGRYCAFGNLFARLGIGSEGTIHRLDRHPSMSRHPVTPADESDLRLHLARQTSKRIGLLDILGVALPLEESRKLLASLINNRNEIIFIDAVYQEQLQQIGALLDDYAHENTLFSVGSSGIEMALGAHWQSSGLLHEQNQWADVPSPGPVLVISGSCSPVTSNQIAWAVEQGFVEIALDTEAIAASGDPFSVVDENVNAIAGAFAAGLHVIIHSSKGTDDKRVGRTSEIFARRGFDKALTTTKTSELYGTALGAIAKKVAERTTLKRVVIAGGDTSGYAARAMGIEAVEMIAPFSPGAPLCRAYAHGSAVDGLEVNFKGGQVGTEDYFGRIVEGT